MESFPSSDSPSVPGFGVFRKQSTTREDWGFELGKISPISAIFVVSPVDRPLIVFVKPQRCLASSGESGNVIGCSEAKGHDSLVRIALMPPSLERDRACEGYIRRGRCKFAPSSLCECLEGAPVTHLRPRGFDSLHSLPCTPKRVHIMCIESNFSKTENSNFLNFVHCNEPVFRSPRLPGKD